jgi:hypothetical protein
MKEEKKEILILAVFVFVGFLVFCQCAAFKNTVRTINDIASDLCMLVAVDQEAEDLDGLSPSAWCAIQENLAPFIDAALSAQQDAAGQAGFSK